MIITSVQTVITSVIEALLIFTIIAERYHRCQPFNSLWEIQAAFVGITCAYRVCYSIVDGLNISEMNPSLQRLVTWAPNSVLACIVLPATTPGILKWILLWRPS